jgi:hypothetical protein
MLFSPVSSCVQSLTVNLSSSSAGGNAATGWISHTGQVTGETTDIKEYSDAPGWELGVRQKTPLLKKSMPKTLKKIPQIGLINSRWSCYEENGLTLLLFR